MSVDLLAIAAHRDDVELTCAGTLLKAVEAGYRAGILDLTAGETGTRGSADIRADEAKRAARILGVTERRNAGLPDAHLHNDDEARRLVIAAFLLGGGVGGSVSHFATSGAAIDPGLFGLSLISVMWAYDGFADLTFASGEVTDPQRNLPRAIIYGTVAIIAIYLLANAAYLYVIPIDRLKDSRLIAADTLGAIFGQAGVSFIAVVVMVSTFGSLMGSMLASPRIFFAMADDRLFFRPIAAVHPRWNTPYVAILLACGLGVAMVMTQTFEQLTDTFVLAMWPFYALSVGAIYTLRRSQPHLHRLYKVVGYPLVPAVFIAAATYLVINALVTDPKWTAITFAVVLAGLPVYYLWFSGGDRG